MAPVPDFHVVIPAGGAGTRLWPLSRAGHPKFLTDLTAAGRTLLQQTWDRLVPLTGPDGIGIVTGQRHAGAVQNQLPDLSAENLWIEPGPRDSMAAIGLAAAILARREGPQAVLGSFAADHVITGQEQFEAAVRTAIDAARAGYIATLGMRATYPATAFGYIRAGEALSSDQTLATSAEDTRATTRAQQVAAALQVAEFVEKPDAATAAKYLESGAYFWNAGMFVFQTGVLLDHLRRLHPDLHAGLIEIAAVWDTIQRAATLERIWPTLTKIAIDHAIAEPVAATGGVAVVPAEFGWDDVGDWAALRGLLPAAEGNTVLPVPERGSPNPLIMDGVSNFVVPAAGRQVVVLGAENLVVVDTPDALLVTTQDRAQEVKDVVDALRAAGSEVLL